MSPMLRGGWEKGKKNLGVEYREGVEDREFIAVENIRLVCLLELTADFGGKRNAKFTPNCQL